MQTRYWLLAAASLFTLANAQAQTVVDAVRMGQSNIVGTARYNAMAGAFGALGGDATSMTDNPAGLGIYRGTSEIAISPNLSFNRTTSEGTRQGKEKKADFSISNLAYILSVKTPECDHLVNFNVGIGINHSASTNRRYSTILDDPTSSLGGFLASTANNYLESVDKLYYQEQYLSGDESWADSNTPLLGLMAYDTYAIDDLIRNNADGTKTNLGGTQGYNESKGLQAYQRMSVREKHRNDEYNVSAAFNWDDAFYFGVTFHISDFNSTIVSGLQEDYAYNYDGSYVDYENRLETSGTGAGFNVGFLWKPIDEVRLGAAVHTPTWYKIRDVYNGSMNTDYNSSYWSETGTYDYEYRYYTPWEYQLSVAYIFGRRAILSLECDIRDFDKAKYLASQDEFRDHQEALDQFCDYNHAIKEFLKAQYTAKAGFEYRFNSQWSGRLGYAYTTSPYEDTFGSHHDNDFVEEDATTAGQGLYFMTTTKPNFSILQDQQYFSGGIGWRGSDFYWDFTVYDQVTKEKVAMYPTLRDYAFDNKYVYADYLPLKTNRLNYEFTIGMKF